ncbi:MAG: hypothetical protein AAB953_02620 [Patescibacteria group bacterium]
MKKIISIVTALIVASSLFLFTNTAAACGCGPMYDSSQSAALSKDLVIYVDGNYFDHKAYKATKPQTKNRKTPKNTRTNMSVIVDGVIF